jgi:hypothetical protein
MPARGCFVVRDHRRQVPQELAICYPTTGPARRHALTEYAGLPRYRTKDGNSCSITERTRLIVVGRLNLGGFIESTYDAVGIVEPAVDKGAKTIRLPVTTHMQLVELDVDIALPGDGDLLRGMRGMRC